MEDEAKERDAKFFDNDEFHNKKWRPKEFSEFADYVGVILFPHVPNAIRLSDMIALGVPIFVPGEPFVYRSVWPMAGPYCGFSEGREVYRSRAPWADTELEET